MLKFTIFVIIFIFLVFSKVTLSQENRWTLVSEEDNPKRSFYYDSKSIQYDGNVITIWEKWVFWESKCDETLVLAQYNCEKRKYHWNEQINTCDGKKKTIDLSEMGWYNIEPESIDEKYYFSICK